MLKRKIIQALSLAAAAFFVSPFAYPQDVPDQPAAVAQPLAAPTTPAELFKQSAVWTVRLRFAAEQFEAIEPKSSVLNPFANNERPRLIRQPDNGPQVVVNNPFAPANFLAPILLKQGDTDKDSRITESEFTSLADRWFALWDKDKTGVLNADQFRAGLASLSPPQQQQAPFRLQAAEGHRNGVAGSMGIDFEYVHADLEFQGRTLKNVGVRYKGNGTYLQSRGQIKKSLKIDTNHFVPGQKFAGISKINLQSNVTDASFMNEVLSYQLYRDANVPAPKTTYARVYVTVPGKFDNKYFGLYSISQDIDAQFEKEHFGNKKGAIFKPVTPSLFSFLGDEWKDYKQAYDPKSELSPAQSQRVIDTCKFFTATTDEQFNAHAAEYIDFDEAARYFAVTTYLSTLDSILMMGQNFYIYLDPKTNKFQFIPWDLDHSFGQFQMGGSQESRDQLSIRHPWRGEIPFFERLFKAEAFHKAYMAKMEEFSKSIFKPGRFHKQVDELTDAIRPAVEEESPQMLERFDLVTEGKPVEYFRGGGRGPGGGNVKPIKPFVIARIQSVLDQLAGKSEGQLLGENRMGGPNRRGNDRPMFDPLAPIANTIFSKIDTNKDNKITADELRGALKLWFGQWNTDHTGQLTQAQLREGIDKDLSPPPPTQPLVQPIPPGPGAGLAPSEAPSITR